MASPEWARVSRAGLAVAGANLALAALNLVFAYVHLRSYLVHPRASVVLIVVMELAFAVLAIIRAPADRATTTAWAWITTMGGSFGPLLLRPIDASADVPWGQVLQIAGTTAAILGAFSLNRSFGILPALRDGVKRGGAYRIVRHPLYAAYAVANLGYLASNLSVSNVAVVVASLACQVARIQNEERLLSQSEEYARYKLETRWRLVPFLY